MLRMLPTVRLYCINNGRCVIFVQTDFATCGVSGKNTGLRTRGCVHLLLKYYT